MVALKMEGDVTQGMKAVFRRWDRLADGFCPRASREECGPANTLILAQKDPFWIWDLRNCKVINLFKTTKFVIICYSSTKRLIHPWNMNEPYNYNFLSTILCLIIYMKVISETLIPNHHLQPFQKSLSFET